jgi:hypothetical protein
VTVLCASTAPLTAAFRSFVAVAASIAQRQQSHRRLGRPHPGVLRWHVLHCFFIMKLLVRLVGQLSNPSSSLNVVLGSVSDKRGT